MRMGTVDFDGSSLEVCLAYVPDPNPATTSWFTRVLP